ncbi:SRPBCC family protein [Spongiivirga citrea]|uniref:AraC family transcriptional regulator n=1 Tax=Spongiivirga citrea TaxID=1481457 RepID=A0A6M0CY02_9FLAO|nr:SRPBCC family protein [Spongiivirga citrea]NER18570.1 AraC family transcriptional regulator [Spongiivirga citrea]
MKIIKYLFFLIIIGLIGLFVYAATKDGSFQIAESKVINAPAEVIFEHVSDFKKWETWGPWMKKDPNMQLSYAENTVGAGGSYSWESETEGNGSMTTIKVIPNQEIAQEITFNSPIGDSQSNVYWTFEEQDQGGTKVSWGMNGEQSLLEKVYFLFQDETLEQAVSPMYQEGLENLSKIALNEVSQYNVNVEGVVEFDGGYYMYVTAEVQQEAVSQKMAEMFGMISKYMSDNNIPQSGMPLTVYKEMNSEQGTTIMSTGIPVAERVIVPWNNTVLCGKLPKGKMIKTVLTGNYTNLGEAWEKAYAHMAQNELQPTWNSEPFEIYMNDPGVVKNPAKWVTNLYIPIK